MTALFPENFYIIYDRLMVDLDLNKDASLLDALVGRETYYFIGTLSNELVSQTDKFELEIEFSYNINSADDIEAYVVSDDKT